MRLIRSAGVALILTAALAAPTVAGVLEADLLITKMDAVDPVDAGTNITYVIQVNNAGPQIAANVAMTDATPAGTTFVSFTAPAGWTSMTPPVGGTGTVTATNPSILAGGGGQFTLVVNVNLAAPGGTIITNTATVASTTSDPDPANNSATATTTVAGVPATPAASLADAAMPEPSSGSPVAILGFAVLLMAMLGGAAILAVRRVRL